MNRRVLSLIVGAGLIGCGEKSSEVKDAGSAPEAVASGSGTMETAQKEAGKFYEERKSKGDTVAMAYGELQKFLPSAPSDYSAAEPASGSSQSMGSFSMSQTEQTFTKPAGADGSTPSIKVSIIDFGGTQAAYGMMALPMMMNLSSEDAHHRMQTLKVDVPYTWGSEEYDKDSKSAKVTLVTRYRYVITVEVENHGEDKSAMARSLAEDVARKFAGK